MDLIKEFEKLDEDDRAAVLCRCSVPPTDKELKAALDYVKETRHDRESDENG